MTDSIAWRKVDSVNKIIKSAKGKKLVDCYNMLAECYLWIWDVNDKHLDTACMYANTAYEDATKLNYKAGVGYAKASLISRTIAKIDGNKNNNDTETAYIQTYKLAQEVLTLADQEHDNYLAGLVYNQLVWVENWKGTPEKLRENTREAIQHFEKISGNEFKNSYRPFGLVNCIGCKGAEALLANLHGTLSGILLKEASPLAKDELNLAVHYYTMAGTKNQLGGLYWQLAQTYFLNYDYKSSEQILLKAKVLFHEAGMVEDEIGMLNEVSKIYELNGNFEKGITAFKNSIKLFEEYFKNNPSVSLKQRSVGQAFFWMSRLYMIAGDYEEALDVIRQGRQYYSARQDTFFIAPWLSAIGDVYRLMDERI